MKGMTHQMRRGAHKKLQETKKVKYGIQGQRRMQGGAKIVVLSVVGVEGE